HSIGGWHLNGLFTVMTGEPFSLRSGVFTANFSHQSRADLVGPMPSTDLQPGPVGPVVLSPSLVTDVLNRSTPGFKVPLPGAGGRGLNIFRGPGSIAAEPPSAALRYFENSKATINTKPDRKSTSKHISPQ